MKKFALSILAVSSLALTACGGGGSSEAVTGGQTNPTTPVVKPNQPSNPQPPVTTSQYTGKSAVINTKTNTDGDIVAISTDNINTLKVNGKTFTIGQSGISSGTFSDINQKDLYTVISGTHMTHAKYGFVRDKNAQMEYYFYQGDQTPVANIPKSGVVNYTGRSTYACEKCNGEHIKGTSKFTADFGKKTLTGNISNERANVALNAKISGNTFSGKNSAGTQTEGAFFGKNAEEVSGIYLNNGQAFAGAFGAKK